jgi:hypothetical protein
MTSPTPHPLTVAHLDALTLAGAGTGCYVTLSASRPGGGMPSMSFECTEAGAHDAALWACRQDNAGRQVYVRTTLMNTPAAAGRRGREADTGASVGFGVDLDVDGPNHAAGPEGRPPLPPTIEAAMSIVGELPTPTMTFSTGGGVHGWWLFHRAVTTGLDVLYDEWLVRVSHAGARRGFHVDTGPSGMAGLMRVAGTHNRKQATPVRVELLDAMSAPGSRYIARELIDALEPPPVGHRPPRAPQRPPSSPRPAPQNRGDGLSPLDALDRVPWADVLGYCGLTHVGAGTVGADRCELWRRDGATSAYSGKLILPDGPFIPWSDALGHQTGRGYTRAQVLANYRGTTPTELARTIAGGGRR